MKEKINKNKSKNEKSKQKNELTEN